MPECIPTSDLAHCLQDPYAIVCCSCVEAERLRCIALARLKELTCNCMSSPVQVEGVRYISPVEAMDALRRLIIMTYEVCARSAELEGPVMETIWIDRCGGYIPAGDRCAGDCYGFGSFHRSSDCDSDTGSPGNTC